MVDLRGHSGGTDGGSLHPSGKADGGSSHRSGNADGENPHHLGKPTVDLCIIRGGAAIVVPVGREYVATTKEVIVVSEVAVIILTIIAIAIVRVLIVMVIVVNLALS